MGFYPVFTDTDKKVDPDHDAYACQSLGSSVPSSSAVRLSNGSERAASSIRCHSLRLAGGERQPGQIFREQLATFRE